MAELLAHQLPLPIGLRPAADFGSFIGGEHLHAWRHLSAWRAPGDPVYLWGPPGSGKTHLLHALLERVAPRCVVLTGDGPARVEDLGGLHAEEALADFDDSWAMVVVDSCDALTPAQQARAFAWFELAKSQGVQFVAAGRAPPVDLPLREDLRSRLGWGQVFHVPAPDEATTSAALVAHAQRRGLRLPQEVVQYLLGRQRRDLTHLMTLLDRLDDFSLSHGRALTVPLLKLMLQDERPSTQHEADPV